LLVIFSNIFLFTYLILLLLADFMSQDFLINMLKMHDRNLVFFNDFMFTNNSDVIAIVVKA